MYTYIKTYAIRHPLNDGRFLIGVHISTNQHEALNNGRVFVSQKMFIPSRLNPWGFKGETAEVIREYFRNTDTCDLYPYPGAFSITPLVWANSEISILKSQEGTNQTPMYIWDICDDVVKAFYNPVSIHDKDRFITCFSESGNWLSWIKGSKKIPDTGIFSEDFFINKEDLKILEKPYYLIKDLEAGLYFKDATAWGYRYQTGFQFKSELDALNQAVLGASPLDVPFEILEVAPPTRINLFRIR